MIESTIFARCATIFLPARCLKELVTEAELLPPDRCYPNQGGIQMVGDISTATRTEVLGAIRSRSRGSRECGVMS